jgi:hypothetical protein
LPGADSAEYTDMIGFYRWGLPIPLALVAAVMLAASAYGIFEWAFGMPVVLVSAVFADASWRVAGRAERKRRRAAELAELERLSRRLVVADAPARRAA